MVVGNNTFSTSRSNQVDRIIARRGVPLSRGQGSRRTILLARGTEEGMEPDDLLCSRNARLRTPLVGRAQWKINQPPSLRDNERGWREHLFVRRAQSRIDQTTLENEIVEGVTRAEEGIGSGQ